MKIAGIFIGWTLVILFTVTSNGCVHSPAVVPTIFSCASQEGTKAVSQLEEIIVDALLSSNYELALSGLAQALGQDGLDIVNCVVSAYVASPPTQQATVTYDIARTHAALWLSAHGKK